MKTTYMAGACCKLACLATALLCQGLNVTAAHENYFPAYRPSVEDAQAAQAALEAATAALAVGTVEEAAEYAQRAARLIPTASTPRVVLAIIAEKRGDKAEAITLYREALAWNPRDEDAAAGLQRLGAQRYPDVVSQYEEQLVRLVNETRQAYGLKPLKPHPVLSLVAREHSAAMRDLGFFSHTSPIPGCQTTLARFLRRFEGYPKHLGENLARRYWRPTPALNEQNIALTHEELMQSPHHRENILHPTSEYVGVGIAVNPAGDYWLTELFMEPRPGKEVRVFILQTAH